ncbi:LysE family translocator [Nitrospirillum iridis]|uniref:Threonine/homoserine/homoserine lactone efflux protein n=1 Tax=Nitrospirillum iridis TaxID=765888 RepID=A0A7X0ECL7_9PROT|nr:LysE family translocator [Nitrospirillum iridis]MBB6250096.1 threonine/homoserine/homoserine lactone efflux protein [Nitrospirillum iridis]
MTPEFLITSVIVAASPGTGAVLTLTAGLSRGTRGAVVAACGCTLGIVPHMLAAITGLAALLHTSALGFEAVKYAGVAYLLYMAWKTLQDDGPLALDTRDAPRSNGATIRHAVLVNLLNPKLSIFFFAFLPQFVSRDDEHAAWHMTVLSLVFMAVTLAVFLVYGVFAASVRHHVLSRPGVLTWMRRGFAAAFIGLGLKLAYTQR